MEDCAMPLHPVYIRLTGATRVRRLFLRRCVLQVQAADYTWHDADEHELRAIGFQASSSKARCSGQAGTSPLPISSIVVLDRGTLPAFYWA